MDHFESSPVAEAAIVRIDLVEVMLHVPCAVLVADEAVQARRAVIQVPLDHHAFPAHQPTAIAARSSFLHMAGMPSGLDQMDIAHGFIVNKGMSIAWLIIPMHCIEIG